MQIWRIIREREHVDSGRARHRGKKDAKDANKLSQIISSGASTVTTLFNPMLMNNTSISLSLLFKARREDVRHKKNAIYF